MLPSSSPEHATLHCDAIQSHTYISHTVIDTPLNDVLHALRVPQQPCDCNTDVRRCVPCSTHTNHMTILITALPTVPTNARTRCTKLSCTSRPTYIPHMPQASEHVQLTTTAPHHVPTLRCSKYTPGGAHALPLCHLPYSYV